MSTLVKSSGEITRGRIAARATRSAVLGVGRRGAVAGRGAVAVLLGAGWDATSATGALCGLAFARWTTRAWDSGTAAEAGAATPPVESAWATGAGRFRETVAWRTSTAPAVTIAAAATPAAA